MVILVGFELPFWDKPEKLQPPRLHVDIARESAVTAEVFDGPAFVGSVQRVDVAEKDR
jgi:hypothetical protein